MTIKYSTNPIGIQTSDLIRRQWKEGIIYSPDLSALKSTIVYWNKIVEHAIEGNDKKKDK